MSRTERKKRPFVYWMAVYAIVFLGLAVCGLMLFARFLSAYEASRPDRAADAFMEHFTPKDVLGLSGEFLDTLDSRLQPRSAAEAEILAFLGDDLHYVKSAASTEELAIYTLISGNKKIGELRFAPGQELEFGFRKMEYCGGSADFSFLKSACSYTVPSDWSVYSYETFVGEEFATGKETHFEFLSDVRSTDTYEIPCLREYALDNYLGTLELHYYDAAGQETALPVEGFGEEYIDNCSPELQLELQDFAMSFTDRYYEFTASLRGEIMSTYSRLKPLLVPGGKLEQRLEGALENMAWSQNRGSTLTEKRVLHCIDLGGGSYLCGVTYDVDVVSKDGETVTKTENNIKLIVTRTQQGLRAADLYSY